MAALVYKGYPANIAHFYGGSILNASRVLTAAHCAADQLQSSSNSGSEDLSTLMLDSLPQGYIAFDLDVTTESNDTLWIEVNGDTVAQIDKTTTLTQAVALTNQVNQIYLSYDKGASATSGKAIVKNFRSINREEYLSLANSANNGSSSAPRAESGGGGSLGSLFILLLLFFSGIRAKK